MRAYPLWDGEQNYDGYFNMNTWKLTIKPAGEKDAFKKCKEESLIGLGWHHAYLSENPSNSARAEELVRAKWKKWPYQLETFITHLKAGDHVWIHRKGKYYLCIPADDEILYGVEIDPEYAAHDLGHARKATWVEVPAKFVTGSIQRGTIARRTIQKIKISKDEEQYNQYIFDQLHADPDWDPRIDPSKLKNALMRITARDLFSLMSPDDVEDLVSAFLQNSGWILIKSTYFRSKPRFEFSMLNEKEEGVIADIQVKSGNVSLTPEEYKDAASDKSWIYLFSTKEENPYPGNSVDHVHTIPQDQLFKWSVDNLWAMTLALKTRLWISEVVRKCSDSC